MTDNSGRRPRNEWVVTGFALAAAFATYFCMYAFRKPFTAATFTDESWLGGTVGLKTALVVSQLIGYTLSKYVGVRVCSEVPASRRAAVLIGLVGVAELSLIGFALAPDGVRVIPMFANGLALGMVWGLVVAYLEGRRTSEVLLVGLSCSYIFAGGVVKDVGRALLDAGVSEWWMPAAAGGLFLPVFLVAVLALSQVPPPTAADAADRSPRRPMTRADRRRFVLRFLPGLLIVWGVYFFLSAYRDIRDVFGVEIFALLGYGEEPTLFSRSELFVALGVMGGLAALNLVRDNRLGLLAVHLFMAFGTAAMGLATLTLDAGLIDGLEWMVLVGLGSYLAYVPVGAVFFDRVLASTRAAGTAVFAIYVADALGYTGSVTVLLARDLFGDEADLLDLFRWMSYGLAAVGTVGFVASAGYFWSRHRTEPPTAEQTAGELAVLQEFARTVRLPGELLTPEEVRAKSPAVQSDGLLGGWWTRPG